MNRLVAAAVVLALGWAAFGLASSPAFAQAQKREANFCDNFKSAKTEAKCDAREKAAQEKRDEKEKEQAEKKAAQGAKK